MKRFVLVPTLAISLAVSLSSALSARAARPADTLAMPLGANHDNGASRTSGSRPRSEVAFTKGVAAARVRDITLRVDPRREGLGAYSHTWGDSLVFDKNDDGNLDVLLSFHEQPWEIWLGNGRGRFIFDHALKQTDRHNCATADFAGPAGSGPDGRADLYCVRGANIGTIGHKRNALLIQQRGGGVKDVVTSWGAEDRSGRGRTVSILKPRGRHSRPSLFVGNAEPVLHSSKDHIFVNKGRRFVQARTGGLPSVQDTYCSSTGDFDRDGRQDFVTCSYSLRLYRNRTTPTRSVAYREVAERQGIPVRRYRDASLVDLNRDGWLDLVSVSRKSLVVRLNQQQSPHYPQVDFTYPLRAGRSFCAGRANRDAATDLLVVQQLESLTDRRQQRDWMLINSGSGTEFAAVPVPQPPRRKRRNGNGDSCSAIPNYRGQRAAWTISNGMLTPRPGQRGKLHRGYRQLVIWTRQSPE
jgi:hypothetical protein